MSLDTIRPILSGIAGALIAGWLTTKWARWVPEKVGTKGRVQLFEKHLRTIRIANALGFSGIIVALLFYWSGWLSRYDWRGLGFGAGLMAFLPLAYMTLTNALHGIETIKECMVTYAISQKTPMGLLFTLMILMIFCGVFSAVSLFLYPPI